MKTAIFIYEAVQVDEISALIERTKVEGEYNVIACGANIEFLLEQRNISYISTRAFRRITTPDRLVFAKQLGGEILNSNSFSFFSYRGVSLAKLYLPAFRYFFAKFLYHLDIVGAALGESYTRAVVYAPAFNPGPAAAILERQTVWMLPDAVKLVCERENILFEVVEPVSTKKFFKEKVRYLFFKFKQNLFGYVISALNLWVRIKTPKKKIRILASELWKNIAPVMKEMPDAELLLVDRAESLKIGISSILYNRMQFVRGSGFISSANRRTMAKTRQSFAASLENLFLNASDLLEKEFQGYSLSPILKEVLTRIITAGGERTLNEIEGSWKMMDTLKPNIVLVRAGTSAQTHFSVLCEVARLHKVPSLEVQHGIFSVSEGDFTDEPSSEYVAVYGPIVREEFEKHGFGKRSHFIDVGSPRFDVYAKEIPQKINKERFDILCIGPFLSPGEWYDSHDIVDYYSATAAAADAIPNAHVTIKLRASHLDEEFHREAVSRAFSNISHTIELTTPLTTLLPLTDVVVSGHSTAFLEAMIVGKPTIVDSSLPLNATLSKADLYRHKEAGALIITETSAALAKELLTIANDSEKRTELSARTDLFMRKNYLLSDGMSSSRLANLIRSLGESGAPELAKQNIRA